MGKFLRVTLVWKMLQQITGQVEKGRVQLSWRPGFLPPCPVQSVPLSCWLHSLFSVRSSSNIGVGSKREKPRAFIWPVHIKDAVTYEYLNWSTDITSMNKGIMYLCSFILVLNSVHPVLGVNLSWSMYSLASECCKKEIHYFPATYIKNMFSIVSKEESLQIQRHRHYCTPFQFTAGCRVL